MRLLALDTALQRLSVAAGADGRLLAAESMPLPRGHAELLLPVCQRVLAATGLRYADLDALAVTLGPGTFTGVRVGLATVRAIALARRLPVIGLTSLQALAVQARPRPDETVLALLDARRGEVYAQAFDAKIRPLSGPAILALDEALAMLPAPPAVLVGSGIRPLAGRLPPALRLARPTVAPEAVHLVRLVHALGLAGGAAPAPVYLRRPDARLPGDRAPQSA